MALHNARLGALSRHLAPSPPPNTNPAAAAAAAGEWRDVLGRHGIAVNPLGPSFAAEVVGLAPPEDEGAPHYPEISAALQQALWENKVLAIRGSLSTTARCPCLHPTTPFPIDRSPSTRKTRGAAPQEEQFQALIRLFGKLHVKGGRDKDTGKFFECAQETAV